MESNPNFVELAKYCQEVFKASHNTEENLYINTHYVAISGEQVETSTIPYVLQNAEKCILIHENRQKYYFRDCTVECIDSNGNVKGNYIDNEFKIEILADSRWPEKEVRLVVNGKRIYTCNGILSQVMPKIWHLYTVLKTANTEKERILIANLFAKDEHILEMQKRIDDFTFANWLLEQERNQYKSLLDEIKELVKTKTL